MADQKPLRITCDCPETQAYEDCLVHFFLAEREAPVVPLPGQPAQPAATVRLPPDLATVLAALNAAGLGPVVLDVSQNGSARAS